MRLLFCALALLPAVGHATFTNQDAVNACVAAAEKKAKLKGYEPSGVQVDPASRGHYSVMGTLSKGADKRGFTCNVAPGGKTTGVSVEAPAKAAPG